MKARIVLGMMVSVLLVAGSVVPALAQSSVDAQMLSTVQAAFTNTLLSSSMSVSTQSTTVTTDAQGNNTTTRQGNSTFQLAATATDWNVSGTETTTGSGGFGTGAGTPTPEPANTSMDLVVLNGETYIRFTAIPAFMQQQNLPSTWTDVTQQIAQAQAGGASGGSGGGTGGNGGGQGGGRGAFGGGFGGMSINSTQILAVLSVPLDATSVTALSPLPADTIDGQSMNVYQVTLDPQALLRGGGAALLRGGFGGFGGGGFGGGRGAGGGIANATPPVTSGGAAATPPVGGFGGFGGASLQITAKVWIGSDGLVHRIQTVIGRAASATDANGQPIPTTTTTTTTDFTAFNQPVTITAPTS